MVQMLLPLCPALGSGSLVRPDRVSATQEVMRISLVPHVTILRVSKSSKGFQMVQILLALCLTPGSWFDIICSISG